MKNTIFPADRTTNNRQTTHILSVIFVLCCFFISLSGQTVQVGNGSYSTSLPSGEIGPQNFNGVNVFPKVSPDFNQPFQTNDFWSSLIYPFFDSPYSNILYAHPLNFKAVATGLEVGYTSEHIFVANDFLYPYDKQLTVGVSGLSASEATTKHYGDWTVTASWEDGQKSMEATIGHGLPYAFFKITGGDAIITPAQSPNVWHHQNEVLGITVNNKHYGIFAPTGSVWSITSILQSSLNGEDFLSIALLPDADPATLELFRSHAYAFVTNSKVDWVFNESTSELTCEYIYETELKDTNPGNSDQTLTALYRHHWLNTTNPLLNYTYQSPRGIMKLSEGNTFSTKLMYSGILPALPDEGNYNRSVLLSFIEEVAGETLPVGPTYENGKAMARFANIVHIADQLGATEERDYLLNQLKTRLEEWFTAGGEQEYSYINSWDVMTGYPSGYGADNQINDHHFHASYAIVSAATIAMYDSTWAARDNWGGMVNMLIRDANSWDRNDDMFPFLRSFDAYAGHSWAAGHGDFAEGNNQESSSESMNFASATALWGEVTNQTEIRDLGIFLHTTEASALDQYWFDVDEEVFPQDYPHVAIGMVWGGKGVHSTWFGADPEFIHGINLLPITSGSLYLGRDPEYVLTNYNEVVEERNGQPIVWKDIFWEYLALADPDLAISYYYADSAYTPFDGESRAHTYHWLYNLKKMGHVETSVFADIATFAVFRDSEGYLTYVAYNANSQERLVTFSDGFTMTVAPKKLEAISTSPADPNAPVVLLLADKSSGKVPLNVGFTGSYSFDPNGSPLTYKWDFGDGTTAFTADTSHVFTEVGTYDVSLTITNDLNLTTTDNMTIEVLGNGTPYNGTAISIPGIVQAEFYDLGGEGVAYHDVDAVNWGVPFRSDEGVDIEASNDVGGGYNIGWIEDGEWVEYTIDVPEAGLYNVVPLISSVPGGGGIHIEFNGIDLTGVVSVPVTGGWQFWEELVIPDVYLDAGEQIMHVEFHSGQFNLNWIELRASTTDLEGQQTLPQNFELKQNYPNPFNPVTKIEFALTVSSNVEIILYNLLGQQVSKIASGKYSAGYHNVRFNGANLSSGLYIYRIKAVGDNNKEFNDSKKMILLK